MVPVDADRTVNVTGTVEPTSSVDGLSVTWLPLDTAAKVALLVRTVSAGLAKYEVRPRLLFLLAGTAITVGAAKAELVEVAAAPTDDVVEATTLKSITTV